MPFKSEKQRKFLFKHHPKVAKEFAAKEKKAGGHKAYLRISNKAKENLRRGYRKG